MRIDWYTVEALKIKAFNVFGIPNTKHQVYRETRRKCGFRQKQYTASGVKKITQYTLVYRVGKNINNQKSGY